MVKGQIWSAAILAALDVFYCLLQRETRRVIARTGEEKEKRSKAAKIAALQTCIEIKGFLHEVFLSFLVPSRCGWNRLAVAIGRLRTTKKGTTEGR
jgi:hypothetical protein